jgi:hypothetical protein
MKTTPKNILFAVSIAGAMALGAMGTASATTCWASSPAWTGYWNGPNLYVARTMALQQCRANTPYGMYCHVDDCNE